MKNLLFVFPLLLCACTQQPTKADIPGAPGADESISIPVKDLRPPNEKTSQIFSLLITSSGYGIYRKGDEALNPPMPQIFRRLAFEKIAQGKTLDISIHHMVVYCNAKSQLRKGALGGSIGGVIGGAFAAGVAAQSSVNISQALVDPKQFESSGGAEYERAFYTEAENPEKASVFVIYIDAEVNGKRLFVKTIAPSTAPAGQDAYSLAAEASIQYYLSQYTNL